MFECKIAKQIISLENQIRNMEDKLDYIFANSSPEDDGVMEMVMLLAENIICFNEKNSKLEKIFWELV